MAKLEIISYFLIFIAGFLSCMLGTSLIAGIEIPLVSGSNAGNQDAPGDWIAESQIHVYDNAIVIDLENAGISRYAATGSMRPVLDKYSNGIRIKPENAEQIKVGDLVTFEQGDEMIIHRVVEIGEDEQGKFFITRGDNNNVSDGKIRFSQIKYVTVILIY